MDERWGFMRPLCAPLRGRLGRRRRSRVRVPALTYAGPRLTFTLVRGFPGPANMRAVREALVLLAMVARVNREAWKFVLSEHCGLDLASKEGYNGSDNFSDVRVEITILDWSSGSAKRLDPDWVDAELTPFSSELDAPPSANFTAAATQIAHEAGRPLPPLDIPIVVFMSFKDREGGRAFLVG